MNETEPYTKALLGAIEEDIQQPPQSLRQTCFFALVLVHGSRLQPRDLVRN
ncbi:hypothetical protein [cf. Phormidesmis sp. LEGE 11477]|uniref:hypothetical protein n=1 Tax=cf. Phormidesmis sp. LEGE 11477 TaxID=1828680 RepID=UPI00187FA1C9|nr:hypothetical protein [cf. Phormidesmis sp. LEGE 11477]MBE9064965.1 hypothetical protein [cf. Phormidesmis sp. LEGE 11477]